MAKRHRAISSFGCKPTCLDGTGYADIIRSAWLGGGGRLEQQWCRSLSEVLDAEDECRKLVPQLETSCVGEVDTQRVQFFARSAFIGFQVARMLPQAAGKPVLPLEATATLAMKECAHSRKRLVEWHALISDRITDINAGWDHDAGQVVSAITFVAKLADHINKYWLAKTTVVAKDSWEKAPPRNLIESPAVLKDEKLLKTLSAHIEKISKSGLMAETGTILTALKAYENIEWPRPLSLARRELIKARRFCKVCIGMEWAFCEVARFKPEGPKDMLDHAHSIYKKLESKGLSRDDGGMPKWFDKFLQAMIQQANELLKDKEAANSAAKAAPAAAAGAAVVTS